MQKRKISWSKRPVFRILVVWLIHTAALLIMTYLMDSVQVDSIWVAFLVTAVDGLLNALLWPLLTYFLVPLAIVTFGLAALLLNGAIVWLTAELVPGFTVDNFWSAFWLVLGAAVIIFILSNLLTIDDENSWYRHVVKRRMKRTAKPVPTDVPGIIFLEIDGLARPVLEIAIASGYAPTMARWLERGSHVLTSWETDTSSQTSAAQAGILHGNNRDIPAFRWYHKEKGEVISSSDIKILPDLEKEHSDGNGLLVNNGTSRGNLLSGDAEYVFTTASTITDRSRRHTQELQAFFANPYNVARTLYLFLWDVVLEWWQFLQARRKKVQPILDKHHRGGIYPLIRASTTVLMRDLNIHTLIGDMFSGRSVSYSTFVAYDEVAHHSGILDPGALDALYKLDQAFARLESAIEQAPRPYYIVVLSDHGQTQGATFLQRYGLTLEAFVQELMTEEHRVYSPVSEEEGVGNLNVLLTDTINNDESGVSKVIARVFKGQTVDGEVKIGHQEDEQTDDGEPAVYTLASGNLGLITFTQFLERVTVEQLQETFPGVIPGLIKHEGIGFIMMRSEKDGPVVLGANGTYFLRDDRIVGENPLAGFGPNAANHLRRTDSFRNCPDILVNSFYDPDTDEGCAFEELIGFHGGMGGMQTHPFILHPVDLQAPDGEIVGAASAHKLCKSWLEQLQGKPASETAPDPVSVR
jgi:uncharacterized membrane protein YvlD (DUF360 family)